ncbi:T9SS type A sorting domain-containing protein [Aureispira anguillae]|uniref:T9SS type A sorting domain-containing protein n=1 Tax=Aureispira anguillae TaxID=2864201 RepID=A0A915YC87_9BACT|nr:T9SS type A sorting domain-containing protein [Aureispira anguillae]BDS10378.1 T9SS type A sorting domain-containing protein [Aureispira anguillae]
MHLNVTKILGTLMVIAYTNLLTAQISPWGTGMINNQLIDTLDNSSVVFASQSGWGNNGYYPDPNSLLPTYTYDIYIPPSYDGTEPYGLVTFINSGNNGGLFPQWRAVLDEKKLIYIAGDNIGNSINVNIRMGVAMAAVYRLKEVLNIDSTRIYTSGNSGGARMSTVLAYTYPEWFFGSFPNCGSSYPREVAQDYETQNPNSHYEYTIPFTTADLNYIRSFDRRYGILTSYDDFREGDIMNIYHNGMVEDGIKGKFLETAGPHCATTTEHFRDAVNFVEHPHIQWVEDNFDASPVKGNGFKRRNATVQNGQLLLQHAGASKARAYSRDPFIWNEAKGSIFSTSVQCDTATFNQNSKFHIGLVSFEDAELFCEELGTEVRPGIPNILSTIVYDNTTPSLLVVVENPNKGLVSDTIFQATFSDWTIKDTLAIKYHMWDQEIRMEFGRHMNAPVISSTGAKLLDDDRSIRIRWADFGLGGSYWGNTAWQTGTLLTFASEAIDSTKNSTFMSLENVNIVSADTTNILQVPEESILMVQNNDTLVAPDDRGPYQWYLNGVAIQGAVGNQLEVTQNGNYTVSAYTGTNCEVLSNLITMTVVGTSYQYVKDKFNLYPNPNQGSFTIETDFYPVELEITNALGQSIQRSTINTAVHSVDLKQVSKGIYFIKIKDKKSLEEQIRKVIVH